MSNPLSQFTTLLADATANGTLVKATFTKPTPAAGDLKSVDIRPILIKRELKLSFTYHHKTRDIVKNYTNAECAHQLGQLLGKSFTLARLMTTQGDTHLTLHGKSWALSTHPATQTTAPELTHDRPKNHALQGSDKLYMQALGLTDAQGHVLKAAQDKFRQINKYIEILEGLIKQLPVQNTLRVVDMGSGKGYLTFALYDHLVNTMGIKAEVTGVELRPDMVKLCNNVAKASRFAGLHFVEGGIEGYDCTGTNVVIALHACNTATDHALAGAVNAGAHLIVVAPCCHKQIRREMEKVPETQKAAHPLHFLLKFGTYTERMAEMVTDGLRAQLLQMAGYTTNLFEFISDAHTPKNVMIVALKPAKAPKPQDLAAHQAAFTAAKAHFGIGTHFLETLLGK